jgi:hypothetical protein
MSPANRRVFGFPRPFSGTIYRWQYEKTVHLILLKKAEKKRKVHHLQVRVYCALSNFLLPNELLQLVQGENGHNRQQQRKWFAIDVLAPKEKLTTPLERSGSFHFRNFSRRTPRILALTPSVPPCKSAGVEDARSVASLGCTFMIFTFSLGGGEGALMSLNAK